MIVYILPMCSKLRLLYMSLVFDTYHLERLVLKNPPPATVYLPTTWPEMGWGVCCFTGAGARWWYLGLAEVVRSWYLFDADGSGWMALWFVVGCGRCRHREMGGLLPSRDRAVSNIGDISSDIPSHDFLLWSYGASYRRRTCYVFWSSDTRKVAMDFHLSSTWAVWLTALFFWEMAERQSYPGWYCNSSLFELFSISIRLGKFY